jgi:hypothetical protein
MRWLRILGGLVRPLESATETQPQLQQAFLRLLAMVCQHFKKSVACPLNGLAKNYYFPSTARTLPLAIAFLN